MTLIRFLIYFFVIVSETLISQNLTEIFNKNISINTNEVEVEKFFNILSKEAGIDFVLPSNSNAKILIARYENKPLKILLRNLESNLGFKFVLKFEKEKVYILVEAEKFFEKIKKSSNSDLIEVDLKDASLKDFFSTIENFTGKEFIIKNEKILSKKITLKCKKKWEEVLEDAAKILNFSYKIEGRSVVIE